MAGTIVADTLQDGAGNSTAMDNAIYGSAKAWVNFVGSSGSINRSYNVSSVTRNGTGNYNINFTNALASNYYAVAGCVSLDGTIGASGTPCFVLTGGTSSNQQTTSTCQIGVAQYNSTNADHTVVMVSFMV